MVVMLDYDLFNEVDVEDGRSTMCVRIQEIVSRIIQVRVMLGDVNLSSRKT
jgi:hypothetical protein